MKIGFVYDWDLTLTEEFQQFPIFRAFEEELSNVYDINKPEEYWNLCKGSEFGVGYMEQMILDSKKIFHELTNERMEKEFAEQVKLAKGLPNWFSRMDHFVSNLNYNLENHVISVGVLPLIKGSKISKYFDSITAGEFLENEKGIYKIKSLIDPFRKVEIFKRVSKGTHLHEDLSIENYHIKHRNMFVFGDGQSDIDLFRYVRQRGGVVVALFEPGNIESFNKIQHMMKMDNPSKSYANIVAPRDYSKDSILERVIQEKIKNMVESEKICKLPFELVRNWKLEHYTENEKLSSFIEDHFKNCEFCKEKYAPAIYFN